MPVFDEFSSILGVLERIGLLIQGSRKLNRWFEFWRRALHFEEKDFTKIFLKTLEEPKLNPQKRQKVEKKKIESTTSFEDAKRST